MNIKQIVDGKPTIKNKKITILELVKLYLIKYKKIIIYILIASILLFPKTYGTFIGNWINNFFSPIYEKNINIVNEKDSGKHIQNN